MRRLFEIESSPVFVWPNLDYIRELLPDSRVTRLVTLQDAVELPRRVALTLVVDVLKNTVESTLANRKHSVPGLPGQHPKRIGP